MECPDEQVLVDCFGARALPEERARVAAHVDVCSDCRETLSALAQAPDLELASTLPAPVREPMLEELLQRGELDGKYRFSRLVGAGGMGVVVEAEHLALHQRVAIKFMRPSLKAHGSAERRFMNEAQHSARLKSAHIVRVTDVGYAPGQLPYLVMELLEGEDLERHLTKGLPPIAQALRYTAQVLDALNEAHAQSLVHRDLKPANLFLARQPNGTTVVKVLDFGLARDFEGAPDAGLTQTGALVGSPLYMAPEQLSASATVDARADLWALGCVMYRMLTGRLPFVADSLAEVLARIQRDPAPPMRPLRAAIPAELEALVMALLEKSPSRRPASVAEVALRLLPMVPEDVKPGLTAIAMRGSAVVTPEVGASARRGSWWPLALAALVALGGLAWWLWPAPVVTAPSAIIDSPSPRPSPLRGEREPGDEPVAAPVVKKPVKPAAKVKPPVDEVFDQRE